MTTRSITPASDGQKDTVLGLIHQVGMSALSELGLSKDDVQELLARGDDFKNAVTVALIPLLRRFSIPKHIILVPDGLSAIELTAALNRERKLTYFDLDQKGWDFYVGLDGQSVPGRGKKFELVVWKPDLEPGEIISSEAVRDHFRQESAKGHVGAFTQWLRRVEDTSGNYASIPEDNECWRCADDSLCVPCSSFVGGDRWLRQRELGNDWDVRWSFVAFREVVS